MTFKRNESLIVSGKGPFLDLPYNILSICQEEFDRNDMIRTYSPIDYVPSDHRKYGVRNLPSLHCWVEGMEPDLNLLGAAKGNCQRVSETYIVKLMYLYSDLDNLDTSEVVSTVGYALYIHILQNLNINDGMNGPSRVLSAAPTNELIKAQNIKMVDAFLIEILYNRVYTMNLSTR